MKPFSCALFVFLVLSCALAAQNKKNDVLLIRQHPVGMAPALNPLNTVDPIETRHRNAFARFNPLTLAASGLMLFYQHIVSPQISASCVYTRSCSNFAKQGIKEFGLVKGVFLAADRLLRCNRGCENDHPGYAFTRDGKIVDEPVLYKKIK